MRRLGFAAAFSLALVGAAGAEEMAFDLEPGTRVLAPIVYKQLAVFPVVQQSATPATDKTQYLTLTEGLAKKLVAVSEQGAGGTVNRVKVANQSDRPLLLLGGEVILGGQQDRILGKDTIIPAKEEMVVEVYCVEHGRWNGSKNFNASGGLASSKLRVRAKYQGDQRAVWEEVAKKNAALGADNGNATGTYRKLAAGEEGQKAMKPYRDHVLGELAKLPEAPRMVGAIAAVNGRVTSVDVFARPELFAAYRERLLDSIFISAADVPAAANPYQQPAAREIHQFVDDAEAAAAEQVLDGKVSTTVEKKGKKAVGSTVQMKSAPPAAKPVYKSYQANE
jgi:hypothetical protein